MVNPTPIEQLVAAVADPQQNFRAAIEALDAGQRQAAVAPVAALLANPQPANLPVRQRAIQALTLLQQAEAIPVVGQALATDPDKSIWRLSIAALEQLNPQAAVPFFQTALDSADEVTAERALYALATALPQLASHEAGQPILAQLTIPTLRTLLNLEEEKLIDLPLEQRTAASSAAKRAAAIALGLIQNSDIIPILGEALNRPAQEPEVLFAILTALDAPLYRIPRLIPYLSKSLREDPNPRIQQQAARLLGQIEHVDGWLALAKALVEQKNKDVRQAAESALTRQTDWQKKVEVVIQALRDSREEFNTIDRPALIRALRPSEDTLAQSNNRYLLTDYLIAQAIPFNADLRMTGIMAKLITDSADGIRNVAGERLNAYQKAQSTAEAILQNLRFEIGGSTALAPVVGRLQQDLKDYFQEPIKTLNSETLSMWQRTIVLARIGFALRATMSVILFAVGVYLTLSSYQHFLAGTLNTEGFFGAGTSFIGGLALMLATVYTGPLKDIRKSVTDVGTANAAFIGYVHRVQQISHTFSFLYLQEQIDPEKLRVLGELIEDAMGDTIRFLDGAKNGEEEPPRR